MANELGVKLFGATGSAFSCRVQIALDIKGVQYEYQEEDLQNKSPELKLLQYNPVYNKIPVLVHNGKPIAESQVILEYIDETWEENPILPKHPYDRAMARFWAKFIDDKCWPSIFKAYMGKPEQRESSLAEAIENLKVLDKELENKKFFGGENIGFVDIVADLIAFWVPLFEQVFGRKLLSNSNNYPNLCRWKDTYTSCSVIKQNLPRTGKPVAFFRSRTGLAP